MSTAEQLEHESEQTRREIARTLNELRASMTPGRVLDQIVDRVGDTSGAAFVSNLKNQTVNNPLPVAMIGAGLVWLMLGGRSTSASASGAGVGAEWTDVAARKIDQSRRAASRKASEWGDAAARQGSEWTEVAGKKVEEARETAARMAHDWEDKAADIGDSMRSQFASAAQGARQTTADAMDAVRGTASSMAASVQDGAFAGYDKVAGGAQRAMSGAMNGMSDSTRAVVRSGNAFMAFCKEQPLLLAGLGLAIGAAIGAALPQTETESQLAGDANAKLKERAQGFVKEQYEAAKDAADKAFGAVQDEAANERTHRDEAVASLDETQTEIPTATTEHTGAEIRPQSPDVGKSDDYGSRKT